MSRTAILHVERTAVPTVLRWVCRRSDLDATPQPPPASALSAMLGRGMILSTGFDHGDLLVEFPTADDVDSTEAVTAVHRAVTDSLPLDGWTAPEGRTEVMIRRRARG